jgi:hypothetical protein
MTASNPLSAESLLREILQIQSMERGCLSILRQGPNGAYYSHQCWENGRSCSRYVPRDQFADYQQAIEGYEKFRQLTDQYSQQIIDKTRAEFAARAKKKHSRPKSSSRKTSKSKS